MAFTRRLDALNAIAICLGGEGNHGGLHGELKAWQEIASIGFNITIVAPSALSVQYLSSTSVRLTWTINSDNHDGCKVYKSTDNVTFTLAATVTGSTATADITGLTTDEPYYFKVTAYKGSTESNASNIIETYLPLYDEDFVSLLEEIIHKSDGYYLEDTKGVNDAKLVESIAVRFTGAGYVTTTALESAIQIKTGQKTTYEFAARFNDLTIAGTNYFDNCILGFGGYGVDKGGFCLQLNSAKLKFQISDRGTNTAQRLEFSNYSIPDNNFHIFKLDFLLATKVVDLYVDGVKVDTTTITLTGTNFTSSGRPYEIGKYVDLGGTSAAFDMVYLKCWQNDVLTVNIPFSVGTSTASNLYDVVSGTALAIRLNSIILQDFYPTNLIHVVGFEVYEKSGSQTYYIPFKADGTKLTPTISTWAKTGEFLTGNYFTYAETKVNVSAGVNLTATQITSFPWLKYLTLDLGTSKINKIACYSSDRTEAEINTILDYFQVEKQTAWVHIGDSIIATATTTPLITGLAGLIVNTDVDHAKICVFSGGLASAMETLTLNNSDQEPQTVDDKFSVALSHAFAYQHPIYICGSSYAGRALGDSYVVSPESSPLTKTKASIQICAKAIIQAGYYPDFEIYVSLGTNDYVTDYKAAFQSNCLALVDHLRTYLNQTCEFHWLRPNLDTAARVEIAGFINAVALLRDKFYVYDNATAIDPDGDDSGYVGSGDLVHPSVKGSISLGLAFANKEHL